MKPLHSIFVAVCLATLTTAVPTAYPVHEENCDDNQQRTVTADEFLRNANSGYRDTVHDSVHDSVNLVSDNAQKLREHYEKLKEKADKFVSSSGVRNHDLGTDIGESFVDTHLTGSSKAHLSGGFRPPVATSFHNNDGSLLHTVEGLKAHAQGVQWTATGGMLPLKSLTETSGFGQNNGGYGISSEKHSSSVSAHESSNSNSGLPQATITYTPTGWEKHHQSSSLNVQESTKRRNYTDYSRPEIIRQEEKIVVQPLNYPYGTGGSRQVSSNSYGGSNSHSQSSYDHNNHAALGVYQVPMTVIPVLGSNDANYSSEAKSQSMSQSKFISSYDLAHGGAEVKPVKIQTGSYLRPTPAGVGEHWHKLVQGQTSQVINNNPSAILETSFGTTKSDDEDLYLHGRPVTLIMPQSQIASQQSSQQQSSSSASRYESSHSSSGSSSQGQGSSIHGYGLNTLGQGSHTQGQGLNIQSQNKGSSAGRTSTNTYVGNPNAPENSGFAITGENKGFYAKSVELANLLSATIEPIPEEHQNQNVQKIDSNAAGQVQSSGSQSTLQQQSGYATGFIENERKPVLVSGGRGYGSGYGSGYQNNYEKHESSGSSSQHKQILGGSSQGGQYFGSQDSFSGVPVLNEPYRVTGGYTGGSAGERVYDWSSSGSGAGQYTQHSSNIRPVGGYINTGAGYGGGSRSSSSYQSHSSSSGSHGSSGGIGGLGVACSECAEGGGHAGQIQYGYGAPVKSSYGLSSRFAASASNINGQQSESKSASVTINDNGKVDSYSRHS